MHDASTQMHAGTDVDGDSYGMYGTIHAKGAYSKIGRFSILFSLSPPLPPCK